MVRKKQKGLVKDALTGSAAGAPAAANVRSIVAHVPLNAQLPFALEIDTNKSRNGATSNDLAAWLTELCDAATRFEQLKLLQLFRASVRKLTGQEEGYAAFLEATWRLLFRLYSAFNSEIQPLQKNFGLILQDLTAIGVAGDSAVERLRVIAQEELRMALEALFLAAAAIRTDADQVEKSISHLLMLLDFPYVLQVLLHDSDNGNASSYLRRTLQFLADQLELLVEPIKVYQETNHHTDTDSIQDDGDEQETAVTSASTNGVLVAAERCSVALKSAILLASLKDELVNHLCGTSSTSFATAAVDLTRLQACCTLILETRVVNKDLLTQTGLAYCLLMRLLAHETHATASDTVKNLLQKFLPTTDTTINRFGVFGRLAVQRGFVNSLSDDELSRPVGDFLAIESIRHRSVLDAVFESVHQSNEDHSLTARLYAFQVLEAFLRRAVGIVSSRESPSLAPISPPTLATLTSDVLLNWENPSKRVNQFMHQLFAHIVALQVRSGGFDAWKETVVAKLTLLPPHSRARYGALSIIVAPYGAAQLLARHSGLLPSILQAVGIKDVSAAAAALFTQILDALQTDKTTGSDVSTVRSLWLADVVAVLGSDDAKLRASVAMYALPLLLKKDPACVAPLIQTLREDGGAHSLWAILEVLKLARKKISPEKLLGLSMDEIESGLAHAAPEARGAAFEALCASLKTTTLPTEAEIALLQRFLVVSAKEVTAATRMNSLNSLKTVLFRVKESKRLHAEGDHEHARAVQFQHWLELFVVTSVYPGALVQRSIVGLEVWLLYAQVFGISSASAALLHSPHAVTCLLNMLIGSWDVVRSLAHAVLDLYPAQLPGYSTADELRTLWQWALTLCVSPRQRESDAGAHFMQLLYRRSDALGTALDLPTRSSNGVAITDPRVRVILQLTLLIDQRLSAATVSSPMVHGLLLSVRTMIDATPFDAVEKEDRDQWRAALDAVLHCVHQSMALSLAVVGDATSGVGDESLSETFDGVVGEVSAAGKKTEAIPLRVDCRGHLILDDEAAATANETDDGEAADAEQRAVVGSWLAARECGAIVDTIMRRVPLPSESDSDSDNFFSTAQAKQGGDMLLTSLFELKHKGAVAMAYEAFEGVCKSFLRHSSNSRLSALPSSWADLLLERLAKSEQQFILRRSSGFAYSFVAILRAEPRHTAAIILPRVMATLLRLAAQDTDATTESSHLLWRARVHALNILKLIAQDAVLADDVAVYVAAMLQHAIFGFECKSWVVRNSSMMLFAAATQRALGDKRIADGASSIKIPSAQVFSRFPQLDAFLLASLGKFLGEGERASGGPPPPGMFPVLMFLSRLRPSDDDEADGAVDPLAPFVPLVRQCAAQSVLPIRDMAARVLGTIVRVREAKRELMLLADSLPRGVQPTGDRTAPKTANFVHGVLLQAQRLIAKCLLAASTEPATKSEADDVIEYVVATFLPAFEWLAGVQCPSVRAVMWEIIEAVASHSDAVLTGDLQQRLTSATLAQVDALASVTSTATDRRDPGEYKCHRAIVGTFFALLFRQWTATVSQDDDVWAPRVEALLQSPVLEVRKRAFKRLARFLEATSASPAIATRLHAVLVQQLTGETHPTVKARLLQHLVVIQDATQTSANGSSVSVYLALLDSSANVAVIGPALTLLASSVSASEASIDVLATLQRHVTALAVESQPLALRYAAAVAIDRSGLLAVRATQPAATVDAWLAAIKLLQDDDSHVRGVVRSAVYIALRGATALDASVSETALLPVAIQHLVQRVAASSVYGQEAVKRLVLSVVDAPSVLVEYSTGAKAQDAGELCTRIFEAEGNNFYAESELLAQLLATAGVFDLPNGAEFKTEVLATLSQSIALINASRAREQWLGGITYYATVFPTLVSVLSVGVAALVALTKEERESAHMTLLAQLQQQAQEAVPHLKHSHPLVLKAVEAISTLTTDASIVQQLVFLSPSWSSISN